METGLEYGDSGWSPEMLGVATGTDCVPGGRLGTVLVEICVEVPPAPLARTLRGGRSSSWSSSSVEMSLLDLVACWLLDLVVVDAFGCICAEMGGPEFDPTIVETGTPNSPSPDDLGTGKNTLDSPMHQKMQNH